MGIIGGIIGGALGAAGGFLVGGPAGAVGGAALGYEMGDEAGDAVGGSHANTNYGAPVDYSTSMDYMSDNNKTTALAQVQAQEFAIQQASIDREMQNAANLELGLERLDTNLQTAKMSFIEQMSAEENHHVENMVEIRNKHAALESSGPRYVEIAPPEFFTDSF
jgi:hypothetical protein